MGWHASNQFQTNTGGRPGRSCTQPTKQRQTVMVAPQAQQPLVAQLQGEMEHLMKQLSILTQRVLELLKKN
jgi:hypothetical protein